MPPLKNNNGDLREQKEKYPLCIHSSPLYPESKRNRIQIGHLLLHGLERVEGLCFYGSWLPQGADAKILDLSQRGGVTLKDLFNLDDLTADDARVLLEAKRDIS